MKSSARKVELASASDLFTTEQERQDAKLEKVQNIPLSELYPFPDHPFSVKGRDQRQQCISRSRLWVKDDPSLHLRTGCQLCDPATEQCF